MQRFAHLQGVTRHQLLVCVCQCSQCDPSEDILHSSSAVVLVMIPSSCMPLKHVVFHLTLLPDTTGAPLPLLTPPPSAACGPGVFTFPTCLCPDTLLVFSQPSLVSHCYVLCQCVIACGRPVVAAVLKHKHAQMSAGGRSLLYSEKSGRKRVGKRHKKSRIVENDDIPFHEDSSSSSLAAAAAAASSTASSSESSKYTQTLAILQSLGLQAHAATFM